MIIKLPPYLISVAVLVASLFCLIWINNVAEEKRSIPRAVEDGGLRIYRVAIQREVYGIYIAAGLWGAKAVHVNRYFNRGAYYPPEETHTIPFPIQTFDIRPAYERGLNSQNWLFISAKMGLVRAITTVLPEPVFQARLEELASNHAFSLSGEEIKGYDQDISITVATLRSLTVMSEPVVVDVDAAFFLDGMDPVKAAEMLKEKCPDIRLLVLIESHDEPDVTAAMRENLDKFQSAITGSRGRKDG